MTSRELKRSGSCSRYTWMQISRKPLEIEARFQRTQIGNGISQIEWSRDWRPGGGLHCLSVIFLASVQFQLVQNSISTRLYLFVVQFKNKSARIRFFPDTVYKTKKDGVFDFLAPCTSRRVAPSATVCRRCRRVRGRPSRPVHRGFASNRPRPDPRTAGAGELAVL